MNHDDNTLGVLGLLAPSLGVARWIDGAGTPLPELDIHHMQGAYKLIFCFQDACTGCHTTGFPSFTRIVDAFRGSKFISFAAVQTVFEDFEFNT